MIGLLTPLKSPNKLPDLINVQKDTSDHTSSACRVRPDRESKQNLSAYKRELSSTSFYWRAAETPCRDPLGVAAAHQRQAAAGAQMACNRRNSKGTRVSNDITKGVTSAMWQAQHPLRYNWMT
eukprot:1157997-Pelagomonas_calceolata.AAC.4